MVSVQNNKKNVLILFDYGNVERLKWDPGYGRVGILGLQGGVVGVLLHFKRRPL